MLSITKNCICFSLSLSLCQTIDRCWLGLFSYWKKKEQIHGKMFRKIQMSILVPIRMNEEIFRIDFFREIKK